MRYQQRKQIALTNHGTKNTHGYKRPPIEVFCFAGNIYSSCNLSSSEKELEQDPMTVPWRGCPKKGLHRHSVFKR